MIWLNTGLSWKIIKIQPTSLFFKIDLCSATSIESSRQVLSNDMAKHWSILKNNQYITYSLIFQGWTMFSHINGKISPSPFKWYGWTLVYLEIQSKYILLPYFSSLTNVQPHQSKALVESFQMIWLNKGPSSKIIKIHPTPLFFKIDLCSATLMESSHRVLLIDMAEHRPPYLEK